MKFKFLTKSLTAAVFAASVMIPSVSDAYISGNKMLVKYQDFKNAFNQNAGSIGRSLSVSTVSVLDFEKAGNSLRLAIFSPVYPDNVYDMDFDDQEYMNIQDVLYYGQEFDALRHELIAFNESLFTGNVMKFLSETYLSFKYMDEKGDEFIRFMEEVDTGVEKCIKYSATIPEQVGRGKVPQFSDALGYEGSFLFQYTPALSLNFNSVSAMDAHLRKFVSSEYDGLEDSMSKLKAQTAQLREKLEAVHQKTVKAKTPQLQGYTDLYQGFSSYLNSVDALADSISAKWKSRLDTSTVHGRVYTGKMNFPYHHMEPAVTKQRAMYRGSWIKAYSKCVNAFNRGRSAAQQVDKNLGVQINQAR